MTDPATVSADRKSSTRDAAGWERPPLAHCHNGSPAIYNACAHRRGRNQRNAGSSKRSFECAATVLAQEIAQRDGPP